MTTTATLTNQTAGAVSFSNITVTEDDVGTVTAPFLVTKSGTLTYAGTVAGVVSGLQDQLTWSGADTGTSSSGSSMTLHISYDVTDTNPATLLTFIGQQITPHISGTGHVAFEAAAYDSHGTKVADLFNSNTDLVDPGYELGDVPLTAGYGQLHVVLTITASVAAGTTGSATFSFQEQGFSLGGIKIDDQVMLPGGIWQDVGTLLENPTTLVGGPVYFRSIITNTGPSALSGVSLTDTHGETLGVTTLTAGQVVTSSTVSVLALTGHNFDTASVRAISNLATISATDTADYNALTPSITVDKQVSLDGTTWQDQGTLLEDPTTLVGNKVYFRAIVTDTGETTLDDDTLTDLNQHKLSLLAPTLTAGETATSNTITLTAASLHNVDSVSVVCTAASGGHSQTSSVIVTADPTGLTPSPCTTLFRSLDGTTWQDQGTLLEDPTTLVGNKVYFRAIVTDTGET